MRRPGRPLGVSLAIIASGFLFSVLPLMQVGLVLMTRRQYEPAALSSGAEPFASGAEIVRGITGLDLLAQTILALVFLAASILAWRGRPSQVRLIFIISVVVMTVIKIIAFVVRLRQGVMLEQGISSGDDVFQSLALGQVALDLLVMLYVLWYLNRGPARAFFRGYFLPAEHIPNEPEGQG